MVCAISVAAVLAAWPRIHGIMKTRARLAAQAREFDRARDAADAVQTYQLEEKAVVTGEAAEYDAKLPAGECLPELLAEVKRACLAAGLASVTITTRPVEPLELADGQPVEGQEGRCNRVPIVLSGTAGYRGLAALLGNLASGRRLVIVKTLNLEKAEASAAQITFTAEAEAFCFIRPADSERGDPLAEEKSTKP